MKPPRKPQAAGGHEDTQAPGPHPQCVPGQHGQQHVIGHDEDGHQGHQEQDEPQFLPGPEVIQKFLPGVQEGLPWGLEGRGQLHEHQGHDYRQ